MKSFLFFYVKKKLNLFQKDYYFEEKLNIQDVYYLQNGHEEITVLIKPKDYLTSKEQNKVFHMYKDFYKMKIMQIKIMIKKLYMKF